MCACAVQLMRVEAHPQSQLHSQQCWLDGGDADGGWDDGADHFARLGRSAPPHLGVHVLVFTAMSDH